MRLSDSDKAFRLLQDGFRLRKGRHAGQTREAAILVSVKHRYMSNLQSLTVVFWRREKTKFGLPRDSSLTA